ncbi:MAG: formate dehydrogenase [Chloroflexi bacterium]|nr:formate dehydrogenase [Chloroflexota bacterium]
MRHVSTICPRDCYDTCALVVTVDDAGRVVSVRGDPTHPVTRGITCPRAARDGERLYRNRVEAPLLRQAGHWRPVDWPAALNLAARRLSHTLETYGPQAVLFLDYAGNTGLLTSAFPKRLWYALGVMHTDHALCSRSGSHGLALHYGTRYGLAPEDLLHMDLIVFWGFNAAVSSPHLWALACEARRQRGARIAVVDPRRSETARAADLWVQPRAGSDVALAYGLMQQLLVHGRCDVRFLADWTVGLQDLATEASNWPAERVAEVTGVAPEALRGLAEAYSRARPSATLAGIGLQKCDHGADQVRAVALIPALLGQHRGFYYSNGDAFYANEDALSGRSRVLTAAPVVSQVAMPKMVRDGHFKFVYIHLMNPALTLPQAQAFRDGLLRQDVFVVVHESHWTRTVECADVVLPAPTFLEKEDLVIPWSHNYVQGSLQVVPRLTDSRSEVEVMQALAQRLGCTQDWLYEGPWQALESAMEGALEEGSFQELCAGARLKLRLKPQEQYPTPSGKIEFAPQHAAQSGWSPLPLQRPLPDRSGQFLLLTSATPRYTHTQFQEVYGPIPSTVVIHPQDAAGLGIADGQMILLIGPQGRVQAQATVADLVPPGVLWSPRQWEGPDGVPQNVLMSCLPQEIGGGPRFNSTQVSILAVVEEM